MASKKIQKIDINNSIQKELMLIPGVGSSLAQKILAYINEHGAFKVPSDLIKVEGISAKFLDKIEGYISINPNTSSKLKIAPPLIYFRGTSRKVRSKIQLRNLKSDSSKPFKVKFGATNLRTRNEELLSEFVMPVYSNPLSRNALNLSIPLSKNTPPGTHTTDFYINSQLYKAVFEIEERIFATIRPNKFFIEAKPGATIKKQILVSNNGNVPLEFSDPGPIILETNFLECRAIRDVVQKIDKKKANFDKVICLFTEKLEELYVEGGILRVRLSKKTIKIKPGETQKIELVISLPSKLKRPNRYTGTFKFYNASLQFEVNPKSKSTPIT